MERNLWAIYVAGGLLSTSCGQPGDNVNQNVPEAALPGAAQVGESSLLGVTSMQNPTMPLVLKNVDPKRAKALVFFASPADPNRICTGALGYEATFLEMSSGWDKLNDNFFWQKRKNVDVFLFADRRCLERSDGKQAPSSFLKAWIYRPDASASAQLKRVETTVFYKSSQTHVLRFGTTTTSVARIWQFRLTNGADILDIGSTLHPVCPFKLGYGNVNFLINSRGSDPVGQDVKHVNFNYLQPYETNSSSFEIASNRFQKSSDDRTRLYLNPTDQSNSAVKVSHRSLGAPVFFSSSSAGNPKNLTCLYGILSGQSFPQGTGADMISPEIRELSKEHTAKWFTADSLATPNVNALVSGLSATDPSRSLDTNSVSVSVNALGKLAALAKRPCENMLEQAQNACKAAFDKQDELRCADKRPKVCEDKHSENACQKTFDTLVKEKCSMHRPQSYDWGNCTIPYAADMGICKLNSAENVSNCKAKMELELPICQAPLNDTLSACLREAQASSSLECK